MPVQSFTNKNPVVFWFMPDTKGENWYPVQDGAISGAPIPKDKFEAQFVPFAQQG